MAILKSSVVFAKYTHTCSKTDLTVSRYNVPGLTVLDVFLKYFLSILIYHHHQQQQHQQKQQQKH